jgi:hypothetical protein
MLAYICSEAPCEGVHINRLGLTYLSGGKAINESGILSLKPYPDTSVPDTALKLGLKFSTVTCLASNFALNLPSYKFQTLESSKL